MRRRPFSMKIEKTHLSTWQTVSRFLAVKLSLKVGSCNRHRQTLWIIAISLITGRSSPGDTTLIKSCRIRSLTRKSLVQNHLVLTSLSSNMIQAILTLNYNSINLRSGLAPISWARPLSRARWCTRKIRRQPQCTHINPQHPKKVSCKVCESSKISMLWKPWPTKKVKARAITQ